MRASTFIVFAVVLGSCKDTSGPKTTEPEPASITLAGAPTNLVPGQESGVQATVKTANGTTISQPAINWSTSNESVASVSQTGTVKGVAPGSATITAKSGNATANFAVTVDEGGVVGTAGATLTGLNGAITVVVPAGAVPGSTILKFRALNAAATDPTHLRSSAITIEAAGAGGPTSFVVPARLTLTYNPAEAPIGLAETRLGLRTLNGNEWAPINGSTVDAAADKVTANITGPGSYGVGLVPSAVACTAPEHRLFDFRLGSYTWAGPNNLTGEGEIVAETSRCALHETLRISNGNTVRAVFFYEPGDGQWHYTSVDGTAVSRLSGGAEGERMILYTPNRDRRVVWEKLSTDSHRQTGEMAAAGNTWTQLGAGVYTRKTVTTPANVVTPAGGTITLLDGAVRIVVPAGAVTENVTINATVAATGGPLDPSLVRGQIYTITATPTATFLQPVNVTLSYNGNNGPSGVPESHFGLAQVNATTWRMATSSTVNTQEDKVSGDVTTLGVFAARRAPQTGCTAPEYRQFDFWVGEWNVGPIHSSITQEESGCAIFENWRGTVPGRSLNVYDPITQKWHQTWVIPNSPATILTGGLVDGKMVMYGYNQSGAIVSRWTWERIDANTVTQKAESTSDNGVTYTTGFFATYVRR